MAVADLRGVLIEAPDSGGSELATRSDAMIVRTTSQAVQGLAATRAQVTRLRFGFEGTWRGIESGGSAFVPRLEMGLRHDGGDAETGAGVEVGGGVVWSDRASGLSAEVSGRGLFTHAADGFDERGLAGSLAWDPRPDTDRGLEVTLRQTMGTEATGGVGALLSRGTLTGLVAGDDEGSPRRRRLEARLGYGFPAFEDRFTATPEIGFGFSRTHREYSLGWRLGPAHGDSGALELRLEGTRQERVNNSAAPQHAVGLRLEARW